MKNSRKFPEEPTFVTTTYGHWTTKQEPYIVSLRLKLGELDERAAKLPKTAAK